MCRGGGVVVEGGAMLEAGIGWLGGRVGDPLSEVPDGDVTWALQANNIACVA